MVEVGNTKFPLSSISFHSDVIMVYLASSSGVGIPVGVSLGSNRQCCMMLPMSMLRRCSDGLEIVQVQYQVPPKNSLSDMWLTSTKE